MYIVSYLAHAKPLSRLMENMSQQYPPAHVCLLYVEDKYDSFHTATTLHLVNTNQHVFLRLHFP